MTLRSRDRRFVLLWASIMVVALVMVTSIAVLPPYLRTGSTSSAPEESMATTATCPSNAVCGSFTNAPTGQVRVESVQAMQQMVEQSGTKQVIVFAVTFRNVGDSPIYIPDGSVGVSTSIPSDSSVIRQVASPQCAGTYVIGRVDPGQNYTLYGPDCGAGFVYQLAQAGSVNVTFSFNWTTNSKASTNPTDFPNSTRISTQFAFP